MDFVGATLGALTIPMVLLNASAGLAALWMIARGDGVSVLVGAAMFVAASLLAPLLSDRKLSNLALANMMQGRRGIGYAVATAGALLPVLVILAWEVACFDLFLARHAGRYGIAVWLFSYGVAAGPWCWRAYRAPPRDRTLNALQAYSAQVSYVILSAGLLLFGWSRPTAQTAALVPMALPIIVGLLLAITDRAALRDVQI